MPCMPFMVLGQTTECGVWSFISDEVWPSRRLNWWLLPKCSPIHHSRFSTWYCRSGRDWEELSRSKGKWHCDAIMPRTLYSNALVFGQTLWQNLAQTIEFCPKIKCVTSSHRRQCAATLQMRAGYRQEPTKFDGSSPHLGSGNLHRSHRRFQGEGSKCYSRMHALHVKAPKFHHYHLSFK